MTLHFFPENSLTHSLTHSFSTLIEEYNQQRREFPGGLVVRIQCFHCCGPGPLSGWETDPTNCTVGQNFLKIKKFRLKKKGSRKDVGCLSLRSHPLLRSLCRPGSSGRCGPDTSARLRDREGTDRVWLILCAGHFLDVLYIYFPSL